MARRFVVEHKQMQEQRVDVLWNATWKYTILIVWWVIGGLAAGAFITSVLEWMYRRLTG